MKFWHFIKNMVSPNNNGNQDNSSNGDEINNSDFSESSTSSSKKNNEISDDQQIASKENSDDKNISNELDNVDEVSSKSDLSDKEENGESSSQKDDSDNNLSSNVEKNADASKESESNSEKSYEEEAPKEETSSNENLGNSSESNDSNNSGEEGSFEDFLDDSNNENKSKNEEDNGSNDGNDSSKSTNQNDSSNDSGDMGKESSSINDNGDSDSNNRGEEGSFEDFLDDSNNDSSNDSGDAGKEKPSINDNSNSEEDSNSSDKEISIEDFLDGDVVKDGKSGNKDNNGSNNENDSSKSTSQNDSPSDSGDAGKGRSSLDENSSAEEDDINKDSDSSNEENDSDKQDNSDDLDNSSSNDTSLEEDTSDKGTDVEGTEDKQEEKESILSEQANNFLNQLNDLPPFDKRNRGGGYAIDTNGSTDLPDSIIRTLITKFLNQRFCKRDSDLNHRANSLEKCEGYYKWEVKDVVVHSRTHQLNKVLNDKYSYDYEDGTSQNVPLSFYFDMSGSMSKYTNMLATIAIELLKKKVKVLVGFNEKVNLQIESIRGDIDVKTLASVIERAGYLSLSNEEQSNFEKKMKDSNVTYKYVNQNLDTYLISKRAEKCAIFADFDPKREVENLSHHTQVYWFCFEDKYTVENTSNFEGFMYKVKTSKDILEALVRVNENRFETLCYIDNGKKVLQKRPDERSKKK